MKTIRVRAMLAFCFCALCVFLPLSARAGFPGNVIEAAGRIVQEPVKIVEKANEEATKVVTKVNKEATEGVKDVNKAVTEVATKANKEATEGVKDVNTTVTEIAADANQQVTDRLAEANTKVTKGVQRAAEQAKAFNKVVKWNLEKAGRDSEAEVGRFGKNLEDAAHAIGHFLERQGQDAGAALSNAERRIREGKVVDAIWHLSTEPLQHTSENAALAAQESEYLNTVAQTAASAYGGPAGAAAYAAWLTYEQTGNADLALRAGVLTYATSSAFSAAGKMNTATTSDIAKKAAVTAAIGGLAVAAAGGDETAVQQGFIKAGAMVLVQDGYKKYTGTELDARGSENEAYCMTAEGQACSPPESAYVRDANHNIVRNAKGEPIIDMSKVDPRRPHVGIMGGAGTPHWSEERSAFMTSVSRIPGMNAMAVFHDQWTISWDMGSLTTGASIVPAIVLTYTGTGAGYYEHLRNTVLKSGTPAIAGVQGVTFAAVPQNAASGELVSGTSAPQVSDEFAFSTASAITAIACVSDNQERSVVIDVPDAGTSCRVVELSSSAAPLVIASSARVDACMQTANEWVKQVVSGGSSCFVRNTGHLLREREPPPEIREAVNTQAGKRFPSLSNFSVGFALFSFVVLISAGTGYFARHIQHKVTVSRARRRHGR